MILFQYDSYKEFLTALVKSQKNRGFLSALARHAGCTHSYLSQVLRGSPHLTVDQAAGISELLRHDEGEYEYFISLVLLERAATERLRQKLKKKLNQIREKKHSLKSAVAASSETATDNEAFRNFYYSRWQIPAIHILTASSDYQSIEQIAERILLPILEVEKILLQLCSAGLVKTSGRKFMHTNKNIHLPTDSIHNFLNHMNWRLKGLESTQQKDSLHYTASFCISRKHWEKIKTQLVTYIEEQRKLIGSSGSEEAYTFCCDLFRI